jgi:hypothetical protein
MPWMAVRAMSLGSWLAVASWLNQVDCFFMVIGLWDFYWAIMVFLHTHAAHLFLFFCLSKRKETKEKDTSCPIAPRDRKIATRCFHSSLLSRMALVVSLSLNKGAIIGWTFISLINILISEISFNPA